MKLVVEDFVGNSIANNYNFCYHIASFTTNSMTGWLSDQQKQKENVPILQ